MKQYINLMYTLIGLLFIIFLLLRFFETLSIRITSWGIFITSSIFALVGLYDLLSGHFMEELEKNLEKNN